MLTKKNDETDEKVIDALPQITGDPKAKVETVLENEGMDAPAPKERDAIAELIAIQAEWSLRDGPFAQVLGISAGTWWRWKQRKTDPSYSDVMKARKRALGYSRARLDRVAKTHERIAAHGC